MLDYKYAFFRAARAELIKQIKELKRRVKSLKRDRQKRDRERGGREDLLASEESDEDDPELKTDAPLEVPGGKLTDIGAEEILHYTTGQFFHLCEHWRQDWTRAEDFSLGKFVQKIETLLEQETDLKEGQEAQEATATQMSSYNGLFKLMKKSSEQQLKSFVDKRV